MSDKETLAKEDLAKIIRGALVENWSCYETASKWDEDVLLTGCKKVGNGQGYLDPEQAAQNLALDAADAILSALRASTQGGEEIGKMIERLRYMVVACKSPKDENETTLLNPEARRLMRQAADALGALSSAPSIRDQHPDDIAVDRFAAAMKHKLWYAREANDRGGWEDKERWSREYLSRHLREHVEKGDPVDVANFCMMLHQLDETIAPIPKPAPSIRDQGESIEHLSALVSACVEAFGPTDEYDRNDEDICSPPSGITFGMIRDAQAAIRALSSKPTAGEGWRPIETAPKDGQTEVIGIGPRGHIHKTWFFAPSSRTQQWLKSHDSVPWQPTHWMPLPPAPAAPAKGEDA